MIRAALSALVLSGFAAAADATTITVAFSEEFAEKLEDDYGLREGTRLTEEIIEDIERELDRSGVEATRIDVMILDAKPNRPTFGQLRDTPGLDPIRSISLGGMSMEGKITHSSGAESTVEYSYFENDIRQVVSAGTWWDANRASRRFAKRVAEDISGQ